MYMYVYYISIYIYAKIYRYMYISHSKNGYTPLISCQDLRPCAGHLARGRHWVRQRVGFIWVEYVGNQWLNHRNTWIFRSPGKTKCWTFRGFDWLKDCENLVCLKQFKQTYIKTWKRHLQEILTDHGFLVKDVRCSSLSQPRDIIWCLVEETQRQGLYDIRIYVCYIKHDIIYVYNYIIIYIYI